MFISGMLRRFFRIRLAYWRALLICLMVLLMTIQPVEGLVKFENLAAAPAAMLSMVGIEPAHPAVVTKEMALATDSNRSGRYAKRLAPIANVRTSALAAPTPSGAKPPYPLNHILDNAYRQTGAPPTNHNFETAGYPVGAPPANSDFSAASYPVGTPPTNSDFSSGSLTGWTTSGTVTLQNDATRGYWAKLDTNGVLISAPFTVDAATQQILFEVGYVHATITTYVDVYVLSGANYATETKIKSLGCLNCGWRTEFIDASPYRGQSIKVEFKRLGGSAGIDAVRSWVALPNYVTSGTAERTSEANGNVLGRLSLNGTITTTAFTVDAAAQHAALRVTGLSTSADYYSVNVLSGANFATATQMIYSIIDDAWQNVEFDLSPWQGQSIKLRIKRESGTIGVDDVGLQSVVAPNWQISGNSVIATDPDGNHYLSSANTLISAPFTLANDVQQLALRYRYGGSPGNSFVLSILRGNNFSQEVQVGSKTSSATTWQTLKFAVTAYAGETIKLKIAPNPLSRIHFDDIGIGEFVLPGWTPANLNEAIGFGENSNGSYVEPAGLLSSLNLTSQEVETGLIDRTGNSAKYYAIAYEIGGISTSGLSVTWRNSQGQQWVVFQDYASTPTGYRLRYIPIRDFMGLRGTFKVAFSAGKFYSLGDNSARQQLNEPFSHKVGLQIDTATGSFGYQAQDLSVAATLPLAFTRYYNGHSDRLGPLGYGWSHSYETRLLLTQDGDAGIVFGSGQEIFFTLDSNGQTFTPADARIHDTLVKNGNGSYTYTTKAKQVYQFNASGLLLSISDTNNNALVFAYDAAGKLTTVTAPGNLSFTLAYDANNRLVSVTDPVGAVISYGFDANGDLVSVTHPDGGVEHYSYDHHRLAQVVDATNRMIFQNVFDIFHRVVQQTDALNKTITLQYSTPAAGVTSVTDPDGHTALYYFDSWQRTTDQVDPNGKVISYIYDANGNMQKVVDAAFGQWSFAYDGNANMLSGLDPLGYPTQFTYNPDHLPTTVVDGNNHVTTLAYDTHGNLTQSTDALGHVTTYTYDSAGHMLSTTNPLGQTESYTYDAAGHQLSRTDLLGKTWQWTYDFAGRVKTEIDPLGHTTTYFYDLLGHLTKIRDALGHEKIYVYDLSGRLLVFTDELGRQTVWAYDARGLVKTKFDPKGNPTRYGYDDNRNMTVITDTLNLVTRYEYDANNRMTKLIKPDGAVTQYAYDPNGRLASSTDALGRVTSFSYDSAGRMVSQTLPNGGVYTYEYDANGNLIKQTDQLGRIIQFSYDVLNRQTAMTDPAGNVTAYTYDAGGRRTQVTNAAGQVTTYAYDAAGRLLTATDPLGHATSYTYDAVGNQTRVTDPLNRIQTTVYDALNRVASVTNAAGSVHQMTYDAAGQLTQETNSAGATTSYTYDVRGLKTKETDALNHATTYVYDDALRLVQTINAANQTTSYAYDAANHLVTLIDPTGATTHYAYDAVGNRTSVTDPLGRIQTTAYDALNHAVTRTDAAGAATQSFYDVAGQLVKTISPAGRTTLYGYDARGLLTSVTDPFGRAEVYEYNNLGQRTKMTDRRGFSTLFAYNAAGQMTSMTNGLGGSVQFSYDAAGQLASVTNPLGKTTSYTYDALGNKATQTDPLGRTYHYAYDNQGRLVTKTDARGIAVNYAYDLLDRLTTVTHPGGTTSYSYDAVGNVAAVTDPTGTTSFSYDAAARVTAIAAPQGTLTYQYDAAGQRTNMTLPGNRVVGYTYNATGRRASMTDWLGGVESFSYDADGNLTGVNRPNNVNTVYGYDAGGRLTDVTHNGPNGALLQYTYTLDENSNRIKAVSPTGTENYTLDALSRLTNVTYGNGDTASYTYDANGNRTSQTVNGATTNYSYDDAGELLSDGVTNYTYDANGNLTAAGADSYTWDWANRLTGATVGGNSAAYSYDAADLRVGATMNGTTSNYLWDRQADIPQLLDDGSHAYLYGDGPLAQIDAGGNRQYLLTDALNSVRGMADNGGNLVGTADYGVFGALRGQTGAASALGFTGGLFTATTGLLHLNARDLSLNLGRFLSADTVQPNAPGTQGYNLYAYVANNPTTWVDPSGHAVGNLPAPKALFLFAASSFVALLTGMVALPWIWPNVIGVIFMAAAIVLIAVIVFILVKLVMEKVLNQPLDWPLGGPLAYSNPPAPNPTKTFPTTPEQNKIPDPCVGLPRKICLAARGGLGIAVLLGLLLLQNTEPEDKLNPQDQPNPQPTDQPEDDANRGRIQIQGKDLSRDMSWAWAQATPPTKGEGLTQLDILWNQLSRREQELRDKAYQKAQNFISRGPYDASVSMTFQNRNLPSKYYDARVDIEIRRGSAFR